MDLNEMLKEAQKLQQDMEQMQKKIENEETTVVSDTGDVTVKLKGNNHFTSLIIAESLKNSSVDELQKVVMATIQKAIDEVSAKNREVMKEMAGKLSLPSLDEIKATAQKSLE